MDVINIYGGPGAGKSTTAAQVFALLKHDGVNAELQREWCKAAVWDRYEAALEDQFYILAKHYRDLARFQRGGVDVVVSDSPLLMSLVYGKKEGIYFRSYVIELYGRFVNHDVVLERQKVYEPKGRIQSKSEAEQVDVEVERMLRDVRVQFVRTLGDTEAAERIVKAWRHK